MMDFSDEVNYKNLIEATKKICGTSYGLILRHKRIMDGHSEKFSDLALDKAKGTLFRGLSGAQRQELVKTSKNIVDEFDREEEPTTFHHLPYNSDEKLEFHLTEDDFQVLDYALLEGDSSSSLKIRSFFQFFRNRYTNQRLVTVMLDTLSCFLGYGNQKPIYEHPLVETVVDEYAEKTCFLLASQANQTKVIISEVHLERLRDSELLLRTS